MCEVLCCSQSHPCEIVSTCFSSLSVTVTGLSSHAQIFSINFSLTSRKPPASHPPLKPPALLFLSRACVHSSAALRRQSLRSTRPPKGQPPKSNRDRRCDSSHRLLKPSFKGTHATSDSVSFSAARMTSAGTALTNDGGLRSDVCNHCRRPPQRGDRCCIDDRSSPRRFHHP